MATYHDPKALRALAHPLRIRLLQALGVRGRATATELADVVGESPSNCSFHLRVLAEHGYLVPADGGTGRQRPWRLADVRQDIRADAQDPDAAAAAGVAGEAFLDWDVAQLRAATRRREPAEWSGALGSFGATLYLTPDEARHLSAALAALVTPYEDRIADPTTRPAGSAVIRLFAATTRVPELDVAPRQS